MGTEVLMRSLLKFSAAVLAQDLLLFTADGVGQRPFRREVLEELLRWQAPSAYRFNAISCAIEGPLSHPASQGVVHVEIYRNKPEIQRFN